jgi:hypothetical protein
MGRINCAAGADSDLTYGSPSSRSILYFDLSLSRGRYNHSILPLQDWEDGTMTPMLTQEQFVIALEMMCYFFTAIGVAFTYLFATRT